MHPLFLQTEQPHSPALGAFLRDYGLVMLPTVLGFLAVCLLLPRVRRSWQAAGALLGGAALLLAGILLIHRTGVWEETLLFYCFAAVAVTGGVLLVTQHNPVYAALSFALVVMSTCGLFLLNGAPFLTMATIIVYAGAIIVTFLFVIMLAQQSGIDSADLRSREPLLASIAGFVLLASLLGVLHRTYDQRDLNAVMAELDWLVEAKTMEEVDKAYGKVDHAPTFSLAEKLKKYLPDTGDPDLNYAARIEDARSKGDMATVHKEAEKARTALGEFRDTYGTVAVRGPSPFRHRVEVPGKLPAENVAALGAVLYTEYLVPVELAGVLLLVATIGAIAIVVRRRGELR